MRGNDVFGIIFSNAHDSSMNEMTNLRTMGSIPFGGRYRLIDFPLSSMVNADITKVGVISKSNYQSLMDHLGNGKPWDLSRKTDGLFLLPPFNLGTQGMYTTRTEALNGAMNFINQCDEKYVILADSNLVANVDYGKILEFHKKSGADITVVSSNGKAPKNIKNMLAFDIAEDGRVTGASFDNHQGKDSDYNLNIYVMERYLLIRLINDGMSHSDPHWQRDAIIGNLDKLKIYAYKHDGFCRMIDSIAAYFDVNMSLLSYSNRKELFNDESPIYTKSKDTMPTRYGLESNAKASFVADGCDIEGEVENCILFRNVTVSKGAVIKNCILMQDSFVGENAELENVILDKNVVIKPAKKLCGTHTYPIYVGKKTII